MQRPEARAGLGGFCERARRRLVMNYFAECLALWAHTQRNPSSRESEGLGPNSSQDRGRTFQPCGRIAPRLTFDLRS